MNSNILHNLRLFHTLCKKVTNYKSCLIPKPLFLLHANQYLQKYASLVQVRIFNAYINYIPLHPISNFDSFAKQE